MIDVLGRLGCLGVLHGEGLRPAEGVVGLPNGLAVADGETLHVRRKVLGELLQRLELVPQVDFRPVQEDGQEGLGRARVVDDLRGEENVGIRVVHLPAILLRLVPLEEKYQAVDGRDFLERLLVEGVDLLRREGGGRWRAWQRSA